MTTDPLDSAFSSLEPTPDARRRMRLSVLAAVEAEQTSLFTVWWRALAGGRVGPIALVVAATAVVFITSPAVALPFLVAKQFIAPPAELAVLVTPALSP